MKRGMTFEYLMCRADLNFEVDFGVNVAIGGVVTKWDLFIYLYLFIYTTFIKRSIHKQTCSNALFNK